MTPHTIIFIGPQGSGKGTQVEFLAETLGEAGQSVCDVQTGRLFRDLAAGDSYAGKRVGEIVNSGQLVPDTFTNALWIADMKDRLTPEAHLLIDGFPRTVAQARVVDEMLMFFNRTAVTVIAFEVPEDTLIERMLDRGRADDSPASIKQRLALYQRETIPVLDYYRGAESVAVCTIDGDQTPDAVQADIRHALGLAR